MTQGATPLRVTFLVLTCIAVLGLFGSLFNLCGRDVYSHDCNSRDAETLASLVDAVLIGGLVWVVLGLTLVSRNSAYLEHCSAISYTLPLGLCLGLAAAMAWLSDASDVVLLVLTGSAYLVLKYATCSLYTNENQPQTIAHYVLFVQSLSFMASVVDATFWILLSIAIEDNAAASHPAWIAPAFLFIVGYDLALLLCQLIPERSAVRAVLYSELYRRYLRRDDRHTSRDLWALCFLAGVFVNAVVCCRALYVRYIERKLPPHRELAEVSRRMRAFVWKKSTASDPR
jgi:hypothetical protein